MADGFLYLSFAVVTPELTARFEAGFRLETVGEWRCGPDFNVADVISPFNDPGNFVEQFYQSLKVKSAQ
ncbi:hypothetical protein EDD52_1108 [Primorskyibacter sedentarius]|uniref:Uncharacterized protein n=1 Tax=Primorskyibacter sedentarius TaxID=745311 RepID=A0A4R3J8X3_9RHOB|nr:hypothetical protein EDD52_1108 [Primorskyibacter sedentarius]